MKNNIAVSIIIPTYNSAKFIDRTLQNVFNQTLKNVQVICVDDCSTDDTWDKLTKYKNHEKRLDILKKEFNSGASVSMNMGIIMAKGEYIAFVDHDDELELNMIEKLYEQVKNFKYDIVCGNAIFKDKNNNETICDFPNNLAQGGDVLLKRMIELLIITLREDKVRQVAMFGLWGKLYKRTLLIDNKVEAYSEREVASTDFLFNLKSMLCSKTVAYVPDAFYHYNYTSGSMSKQYLHRTFNIRYHSIEIAKTIIESENSDYKTIYLNRLYYRLWMIYTYSSSNELIRNKKGKLAAIRQINLNMKKPILIEALKFVRMSACSPKGMYRIFMYCLYFYTKLILLCKGKL
ncbi:MAG TPA: glycosyltransferase family 2 protein [Paludibacteraceae bacterium]|nr:glycosyltransferase family 2 protein [Paludibacteraceae bacterium]HOS36744.1 glycosyltransferase family 2 protein [Paludibacteraceae bacterium]